MGGAIRGGGKMVAVEADNGPGRERNVTYSSFLAPLPARWPWLRRTGVRARGGGYFHQYARDRGGRAQVEVRLGAAEAERHARDGHGRGGRASSL